MKNKIANKMKN